MGITTIIDGKRHAKTIQSNLRKSLLGTKKRPHLTVILVGNDPASKSYVTYKEKAAKRIGITSTILKLQESITETNLLNIIHSLNQDDTVHGILVQLPLPQQIDQNTIIDAIDPSKDVDGLHPENIAKLHTLRDCILPCTPKGIITLLKKEDIVIKGKHAVVIGRSNLVGKPIAQLLLKAHATVSIAHRHTKNLKAITKQADIVVSATGIPNLITKDMVKKDAICIDVGLSRVHGKLTGDFDYDALIGHVQAITPAPGGVGPMTIASLMENTVQCYNNQIY